MGKTTKLTTNEFIKRSLNVFGNRFDYSKTKYVDAKTKVCIICPEHGEFWIRPYDFLHSMFGCPKCADVYNGKQKKIDFDVWLEKAREVHGGKYDYSKVEYINNSTKVCIICPEHGEFWQVPYNHLKGCGCDKCSNRHKPTKEEFIEKAREVHGDKYDYSKVEYKNNKTKVCIICPEHGEFWMKPENHIVMKQGCPICGKKKVANKNRYTTQIFIEKAREVHGDKYDYSKVEYVDNKTKVCIICPEHGEFWQKPNSHLNGRGCPACKNWTLEVEVSKFLIENNIRYEYQKRFDWLGRQSLDFYLPDYNIAIECQGKQHFWGWGNNKENFEECFKNDKKKMKLCEKYLNKILYYTKFDKCYELKDIYNKNNTFFNINELKQNIMIWQVYMEQ